MNASKAIELSSKNGLSIVEFITTYGGTYDEASIATIADMISPTSLQFIVDCYRENADIYAKRAHESNNPHKDGQLAMCEAAIMEATKWAIVNP